MNNILNFINPISDEFKNIYFIEGKRSGGYPYSNSLLLEDILIDTGISSSYIRKLKKKFKINTVINSHWHEDHIAGNSLLTDAKFFCHNSDRPLIEDFNNNYKRYYCIENTQAEDLFDDSLELLNVKSTQINQTFIDSEIIEISDDIQIKIIHTPGHSAGHCCFLELNSKIAFLSDIDFTSFGPWYAGLDSSLMDFEKSLNKLKNLDFEFAVTSHKGLFCGKELIKQKLCEFHGKIEDRDKLILENLSEHKPLTSKDLIKENIIYKFYSKFKIYEIIAEKIMLDMHIDRLLKNDLIEKKNEGYVLT